MTHAEKWKITNNYNQKTLKHKPNAKTNPKHNPPAKKSYATPTTTTKRKNMTLIQAAQRKDLQEATDSPQLLEYHMTIKEWHLYNQVAVKYVRVMAKPTS